MFDGKIMKELVTISGCSSMDCQRVVDMIWYEIIPKLFSTERRESDYFTHPTYVYTMLWQDFLRYHAWEKNNT